MVIKGLKRKETFRRSLFFLVLFVVCAIFGCGKKNTCTITIFAAKSLNNVMDELIMKYEEQHENVEIIPCYDSSGTLEKRIIEGAGCDLFFSADTKQLDELEKIDGILVEGTRQDLLNNQVCVVSRVDSHTKVTGLSTLDRASSIALADGSVPVGKYTRQAMLQLDMIPLSKNVSDITTKEIQAALNGIEINECANVGMTKAAVLEGACEVGTIYYSDLYGVGNELKILERVPNELTGDVIYPIVQIHNLDAGDLERTVTRDFMEFLSSKDAKQIFRDYYFETIDTETIDTDTIDIKKRE